MVETSVRCLGRIEVSPTMVGMTACTAVYRLNLAVGAAAADLIGNLGVTGLTQHILGSLQRGVAQAALTLEVGMGGKPQQLVAQKAFCTQTAGAEGLASATPNS